MIIAQSFDQNLSELLDIFGGKFPDEDVSAGAPALRFAQAVAMEKTSLERKIEFQHKQFFPATANAANLEIIGSNHGADRNASEELEGYRVRVRNELKSPPAGGTDDDYIREAQKISGVDSVGIVPPEIEGDGKVGVILTSAMPEATNTTATAFKLDDDNAAFVDGMVDAYVKNLDAGTWAKITAKDSGTILSLDTDIFPVAGGTDVNYRIQYRIPTDSVVSATQLAIDDFRPIDATANVRAAEIAVIQNISMILIGSGANIPNTILAVENYVNNLKAGEFLTIAQLTTVAILNGATGLTLTIPLSDVTASLSEFILLGSLSVT